MSEKQFIGSAFAGKFHDASSTHIDLVIDGAAMRAMTTLFREAIPAKEAGEELPAGTYDHPKYGIQIKLEIKSTRQGKYYCALNTWKPSAERTPFSEPPQPDAEKKTPPVAEVMSKPDPNDLPF